LIIVSKESNAEEKVRNKSAKAQRGMDRVYE